MTRGRAHCESAALAEGIARGQRIVSLVGPAGVGKTWLAEALLARLAADGAACGRGKFGDDGTGPAHAPVIAALSGALAAALDRQFDPQRGLASLAERLGVQLDVLIGIGLVAPGLATTSVLGALLDHRQWRGRIATAAIALLTWLADIGERPVLLIDDWDRAPPATAQLIAALAAMPVRQAPVLLLTGRSAGAHALLPPDRVADRRLEPLDRAGAIALLGEALADPAAAAAIAGRLGANLPRLPFDLAQLAEVAREADWLARLADPGTLAFAPADRIAALAPAERRAAHALMLWGDAAPRDRLAAALGDTAPLDALATTGIAIEREGRLHFRHDRLREAARTDLGDPARLAADLAEALVGVGGPDDPAMLQLRLTGGLDAADPDRWRDRFAAGARSARTDGNMRAAERFAEAALALRARRRGADADTDRTILREAMLAAAGRDDPATAPRADALIASARNPAEAFADREQAIVALRFAGLSDAALRIARAGFAEVGIRFPLRTRRRHLLPAMLRWHWTRRRGRVAPRIDPAQLAPFTGMATAAATTAYQHDPLLTAYIGFRAAPLVGRTERAGAYWRGVDAFLFGAAGQPARAAAAGDAALALLPGQVGYRGQSLYQALFFGTLWRDRLATVRPRFREVVTLALAEGDPVMAAYGMRTWVMSGWRCGVALPVLLEEAREALRSLVALGEQSLVDEVSSLAAVLEGLVGERPWSPALWRRDLPARSHVLDLELANLAGDWAGTLRLARDFAPLARDYAIQSEGILMTFHATFAALRLGRPARRADLGRLARAAALNPADHGARWRLIEAERLRARGRPAAAAYAEAVALAAAGDSPLLAGLAAEAAADAARADGEQTAAAAYAARAAASWRGWGLHPHVRGHDADTIAEALARAGAAERADAARARLMAHVGHELRTPLQALQAQLDLAVAEGRPLAAATVRDVLASLSAVVDDLDPLGERGEATAETVDLLALVGSELRLWDGGGRAELEVAGAPPPPLRLPGNRLRQVVRNLLSNALKYGGDGPIRVTMSVTGEAPVAVEITIDDTGPGLPDDDGERLFEPFERGVHAGDDRGTGLGLALSRRIVERLGGTLTGANRAEGGARFTARFRAEPASAPAAAPSTRTLDLLLVEDTRLIRDALAALLGRAGHRLRTAGDAAGALAALAAPDPVDAVLLDIGLPDGSGLTVLDQLRRTHGPLPVVLLTAAVGPEVTARVAADPATRLLRKPASAAALAAALAELCGTAADAPPGAPPEYARLRRRARREVRVRGAWLARAAAPDRAAAHQLAGLAAQFGWGEVADAAERLHEHDGGAERLRAAVEAMQ